MFDVLHTVINSVRGKLANRASHLSCDRFYSRGYDPYTHACKARPLTTVGRTFLSVIIIIIGCCSTRHSIVVVSESSVVLHCPSFVFLFCSDLSYFVTRYSSIVTRAPPKITADVINDLFLSVLPLCRRCQGHQFDAAQLFKVSVSLVLQSTLVKRSSTDDVQIPAHHVHVSVGHSL